MRGHALASQSLVLAQFSRVLLLHGGAGLARPIHQVAFLNVVLRLLAVRLRAATSAALAHHLGGTGDLGAVVVGTCTPRRLADSYRAFGAQA